MKYFQFLLNTPWTLIALILSGLSGPRSMRMQDRAIIIMVKSLWWTFSPGVRATTLGNVVLLGSKTQPGDLEHELVHIDQHMREPFVHPFLAFIERLKNGPRHSKYEDEAYVKAGNVFQKNRSSS